MKKLLIVFSILMVFANFPIQARTVINIPDIAGKTPEQVAKILGKATKTKMVKPSRTPCPCPKHIYKNGAVEVMFIGGRADWITVNELGAASYTKATLALLGLPIKKPTISNSFVMRWENIPGFFEVFLFPMSNGKDVFYAYIKTRTK